MRCVNCRAESPGADKLTGILFPHFCVFCGHPMAMRSPYVNADAGDSAVLPLQNASGMPPALCPITGGLLKVCGVCGRLYTTRSMVCETPGPCEGNRLSEPVEPFPSVLGPGSNTRAVHWRGAARLSSIPPMSLTPVQPLSLPSDDPPRAMAFRYGRLVVAGERTVSFWEATPPVNPGARPQPSGTLVGGGWTRLKSVALPGDAGQVGSLFLDDGQAYLQTARRTLAIDISLGVINQSMIEAGTLQCRDSLSGSRLWARIGMSVGSPVLWAQNVENGRNAEALPLGSSAAIGSITCLCPVPDTLAGTGETPREALLVASTKGGILWCEPLTPSGGSVVPLALPLLEWKQVAWQASEEAGGLSGGMGLALGRDTNQHVWRLVAFDRFGSTLSEAIISEAPGSALLEEFVWHGTSVYVPTQNTILHYELPMLSTSPTTISLPLGKINLPGILVVSEPDDARMHQLLVRRASGPAVHLTWINPASGSEKPVGAVAVGAPLCVPVSGVGVVFCTQSSGGGATAPFMLQTYRIPAPIPVN